MPVKRLLRSPVLLLCLLATAPRVADGQSAAARTPKPRLLVVSQPSALGKKADFVDMGYHLGRSVMESGRYDVLVYKPGAEAVKAAVQAGRLTVSDTGEYLTEAGMRKVAEGVGAVYIVRVTAAKTRQGISAEADMQMRTGGSLWSVVFATTLAPYRSRNRRSELLEAVTVHVAALTPRIVAAPSVPAATTTSSAQGDTPAGASSGAETTAKPTSTGPSANEILIDRFRRSGDTANVISSLRRAITEKPRDPRLRGDLVLALRARGWIDAARDEAARAIRLCPADASLHRLLGDGYLDAGQAAEALVEYQEAVRIAPSDAANHVALGDAYWSQARAEEAERAYLAGHEADAASPLPSLRLARIRLQRMRFDEAVKELNAARKAAGDDVAGLYASEFTALIGIGDGIITDVLARLAQVRKDFRAGSLSREEAHKAVTDARQSASGLTTFFSDAPAPTGFSSAQALYAQAAALTAQAASAFGTFLETQDEAEDKEAIVLRQEASRQLTEAAKKVKASSAPART